MAGGFPGKAIDDLLVGRVYMGTLNRNETADIVQRLFQNREVEVIDTLDAAMAIWFSRNSTTAPTDISTSRWCNILKNAFLTVNYLELNKTCDWLTGNFSRIRPYFRSLYLSSARDPETYLLRTIATHQKDQRFISVWMRLCALEEGLPLHYASVGLIGLRKLPDNNGEPHGDVPPLVLKGLVSLAEAIERQGRDKKEGKKFWMIKCRGIMSMYPRSDQYWSQYFSPLFQKDGESVALKWLDEIIPKLSNKIKGRLKNREARQKFIRPPSFFELKRIQEMLKSRPLNTIRLDFDSFLNQHRYYAKNTGDAEFLVKTCCSFAKTIYKQDSDLALLLTEEAMLWEPYNPVIWGTMAKIEVYRGNYSRALNLLWEAKRKIPEECKIRNQLAHLLITQGQPDIAENIYRQAIDELPDNPVCRNGLAEVLVKLERLDEAEQIYTEAKDKFPDNPVCRNGLAEVLVKLERLDEAEQIYTEAKDKFPDDPVCRNGLAEVLVKLERLDEAEQIYKEAKDEFPDNPVCRTGLAKVLVKLGRLDEAEQIYKEAKNEIESVSETPSGEKSEINEDSRSVEINIKPDEQEKKEIHFLLPDLIENNKIESELGIMNLYRLIGRKAGGEEKEGYHHKFFNELDRVLEENPHNLTALQEKGWMLAEEDTNGAGDFFEAQTKRHPHVLGLQLGLLRFKDKKGERADQETWNNLIKHFSSRTTVIKLEHAQLELQSGNGTRLAVLKRLKNQIKGDVEHLEQLPASVRNNEKWVADTVETTLFQEIDLKENFTEDMIPKVMENYENNKTRLKGLVEQCASIV